MIAYGVTLLDNVLDEFRVSGHTGSNHKKSCLQIIASQEVENNRCRGWIRAVIKGDGNALFSRFCPADYRQEKTEAREKRCSEAEEHKYREGDYSIIWINNEEHGGEQQCHESGFFCQRKEWFSIIQKHDSVPGASCQPSRKALDYCWTLR